MLVEVMRVRPWRHGNGWPRSGFQFGQPSVEDLELVAGNIHEGDAHAHSGLDVDDSSVGCKFALVTSNFQSDGGAVGKSVEDVHVASLAADFGDSPGDVGLGGGFGQIHLSDKRVSRHFAFVAKWLARV